MNNIESSFEQNLELIEKDQDLQQFDELKPENNIFKKLFKSSKRIRLLKIIKWR